MALPETLFVGRAPVMFDNSISYQYILPVETPEACSSGPGCCGGGSDDGESPASSSPKINFLSPSLTISRLR